MHIMLVYNKGSFRKHVWFKATISLKIKAVLSSVCADSQTRSQCIALGTFKRPTTFRMRMR